MPFLQYFINDQTHHIHLLQKKVTVVEKSLVQKEFSEMKVRVSRPCCDDADPDDVDDDDLIIESDEDTHEDEQESSGSLNRGEDVVGGCMTCKKLGSMVKNGMHLQALTFALGNTAPECFESALDEQKNLVWRSLAESMGLKWV